MLVDLLPSDATQRIITFNTDESRQTMRCTNKALHEAILQWEQTTPIRLFKTIRHDSQMISAVVDMRHTQKTRALYLEWSPDKAIMQRPTDTTTYEQAESFFRRAHDQFMLSMKQLLSTLDQCTGAPIITRWDYTCIMPHVYSRYPLLGNKPDDDRLVEHMKNATSLERVHIRLCVPGSILFEETPVMLNIVKEALPAWTNLTHLTLSDISTNRQKNTWSLVYILSLTLVRDAKTVKKIHRIWHGDEEISDELLELLETKSKTSPLRTLCLEHIHLDTEVDPLFWLILGAFPPKDRIQLTYCNIEWPDFRYRSTGTIFTPEFYEETEAILTVDVYTGTKMPWHDHMYSDRIFERAKGDPRVVLVKDA